MLFNSNNTWFTADEQYFHKNICKEDFFDSGFCRPWRTEKQMRNALIEKHNEVVKPGDTVIHVGDFAFTSNLMADRLRPILDKLHGKHILVLGNHDELKPFKYVDCGFTSVMTSCIMELPFNGATRKIAIVHDPSARCVVPSDWIFLCGHIHDLFKSIPDKLTVNVGVDVWDYYPITFIQIMKELLK